ncbi:hypothetical protein G6F31_021560 [Rhizopus arrhizus]|nr:hypothetical protein G6F31_021560 [Rhizopus arrhizus]
MDMDMSMKKKRTATTPVAARRPLPELSTELMDHLVKGLMPTSEAQNPTTAFNKALIERTIGTKKNLHWGYGAAKAKPPVACPPQSPHLFRPL